MRDNLQMVWLIARRELRDQLRDWRILFPLSVLTLTFPFLMNEVAGQAVSFFARYGTNLIAARTDVDCTEITMAALTIKTACAVVNVSSRMSVARLGI